jgi:hypothetical protein
VDKICKQPHLALAHSDRSGRCRTYSRGACGRDIDQASRACIRYHENHPKAENSQVGNQHTGPCFDSYHGGNHLPPEEEEGEAAAAVDQSTPSEVAANPLVNATLHCYGALKPSFHLAGKRQKLGLQSHTRETTPPLQLPWQMPRCSRCLHSARDAALRHTRYQRGLCSAAVLLAFGLSLTTPDQAPPAGTCQGFANFPSSR